MNEENHNKIEKKKTGKFWLMAIVLIFVSIITSLITTYVVLIVLDDNSGSIVSSVKNDKNITVNEESATIDAVDKVRQSVVSIIITKDLEKIYGSSEQSPFDSLLPFNFQLPQSEGGTQEIGGGSGFIVKSDGLIVTNRHVVSDSEADYTVVTEDSKKYSAEVIATDTVTDLALLKIDAPDLPIVEFGDSDALKVGQQVVAIGNSLGEYENSVTSGIVSAIGRTITAGDISSSERLENVIQTDAAINPGNSGGTLINLDGQVVGINTAIDASGQLIGFAIPINSVKGSIASVIDNGKIIRPYLGVRYILLDETVAEKNNLDVKEGALVVRGESADELAVIPGSPADKGGIVENDVILEVDGEKITADRGLAGLIGKKEVGQQVKLLILHDGEEKNVTVTLEEAAKN